MITRREHINNAAATLFRKKGYAATSMQEIADVVGIKPASLYNHITSKQEVLSALLLPISEAFSNGMADIENSTLTPVQKLEALVALHIKITMRFSDRMALITGEWVHLDKKALNDYKKARDSYEAKFKKILLACKKEGQIDKNTNIEIALFSILSSLHWLYSWYGKHSDISPIELENQLKKCLLSGIRVQ